MSIDTALEKIADRRLRHFAEKRSDGLESVLIQLDLPATKVVLRSSGKRAERKVAFRTPRPYMVRRRAHGVGDEHVLVRQLEKWFNDIGVSARYLRSAHAFVANVTSSQLREVVESSQVRSIASNHEVSMHG